MILDTDKLMEDYYESVKAQYPDITPVEFRVILRAPWFYLRAQMRKIELPKVRFKYLGLFLVRDKWFTNMAAIADRALAAGKINRQKHDRIKEIAEHHNQNKNDK